MKRERVCSLILYAGGRDSYSGDILLKGSAGLAFLALQTCDSDI